MNYGNYVEKCHKINFKRFKIRNETKKLHGKEIFKVLQNKIFSFSNTNKFYSWKQKKVFSPSNFKVNSVTKTIIL